VVALENVPGFERTRAHRLVRTVLDDEGYGVHEQLLCPSELGVPMRRPRFYLVAQRGAVPAPPATEAVPRRPLRPFLDPEPDPSLWASDDLVARYGPRLAVVDPSDPEALAHVFTGAYGTSPVYAGSWLATSTGPRLFSPGEILRLLGFGDAVSVAGLSRKKAYKVVGNSLSVDAVRHVLSGIRAR